MNPHRRHTLQFVVFSLGYVVLGVLLLVAPQTSQRLICLLLGMVAVVGGVLRIVWYFKKDEASRAYHNDIPGGVLLVLVGAYLMMNPDTVWNWLPVILGFAVVFDSLIKLQHAFDMRHTGRGPWLLVLLAALATMVLGLLLILDVFGPHVLLYYFGIVLIVDGVLNLGTLGLLFWHDKKHPPGDDPTPPAG